MDVSLESKSFPKVEFLDADVSAWKGDLLGIGVFDHQLETKDDVTNVKPDSDLAALDKSFGGAFSDIMAVGDFSGKPGSSAFVRNGSGTGPKYVGLIGMGTQEKATVMPEFGTSTYQLAGAAMASVAKSHKTKTAALRLIGVDCSQAEIAERVVTGLFLGAYEATRFKAKPCLSTLESLALLGFQAGAQKGIKKAEAVAKGAMLTRYLVEAPANVCTPAHLADAAKLISTQFPDVMTLEVLEREDCEKLKMGCYLGVAQGSAKPPKFIHLTYKPKNATGNEKKVGLVGKGITFDSGGYNLKTGPGSLIEHMKIDMGGGGAVLGSAMIVGALEPSGVEAHFIVAACENMIASDAYRPGDILTASNGKTVEIMNTDAEGRLALSDALVFAQEQCGVEALVDIATLTGACLVALGPSIGGLFTPSDKMASQLVDAARISGEKIWRMPLEGEYLEMLKSPIADLKNIGSRWGGSITAALFLKEFVKTDDVDWAHLDVAGPVFDQNKGLATGYAAATLAHWVVANK